jgi:phosphatidylserine/phosphatidylglycerophosphate/cardiolipin synthase-like enzyme
LRNPPARPSARTADPVVVASPVADNPDSIGYTLDSIVSLLGKAQQTAQIEVMEYTTKAQSKSGSWKVLDTAIRNAANRGVKVQLMVDVSDIKKAKAALQSLSAVRNISVISITIPPWSGGDVPYGRLIHAKFLVVDGKSAWVGSENWSESYFTDTRDVGLLTSDPTIISNLGKVFQAVWQSGYGTAMQAE